MLKVQSQNNPDLARCLNEDACKTSLEEKEVDVVLMIDVLEHIPRPEKALQEMKRISKYVILKVPLEKNIIRKAWNMIANNKERKHMITHFGHINTYSFPVLIQQIRTHLGKILYFSFLNQSEFTSARADR
jgi:ubiquinone/menaquinone biosynthesis C-methylase UbiE